MALLSAMETFSGGDFGVYITREICSAMDAAGRGADRTGGYRQLSGRSGQCHDEGHRGAGGRAGAGGDAQRGARKMHLSEDMTRDIMKISMDALSVVEANGSGEVFGENTDFPDSGPS